MFHTNVLNNGKSLLAKSAYYNPTYAITHRLQTRSFKTLRSLANNSPIKGGNKSDFEDKFDATKLRNIGIIAHINAGKTTTTERFLYHAGSTDTVGDVDRGNTVTDYLVQERDRGITITSAAVTFDWKQYRMNLIDTPGHVDFTIEVERSLSVLDGAVTILDASAGVEAQTVGVWNQASKYHLPNIVFLNKYDKPQADIDMCMKDLEDQFNTKANLIQIPVKNSSQKQSNFSSIIDLIDRKLITWTQAGNDHGAKFITESLDCIDKVERGRYLEWTEREREKLINNLSDCDEELANHVISCDKLSHVSGDIIVKALRRATLNCELSPVLVGSSFKYIGVQQLMDAIIDYLPNPLERRQQILNFLDDITNTTTTTTSKTPTTSKLNDTCAVIFKIMHDKRLGALNYLRVYNGNVSRLQRLQNLENGKVEQVKKIYRAFADELKEINTPACRDDIVVVSGLSESRTGDILMNHNMEEIEQKSMNYEEEQTSSDGAIELGKSSPFKLLAGQVILPKISQLEPVYFCSIEAKTASHQVKLEQALACMAREDPSLSYEIDSLGMTTIRGMGKLHLEVTRDRIKSEYGVDSLLGRLQISYRETIDGSANEELTVERLINSVKNSLTIKLYVRSLPGSGQWNGKKLRLDIQSENSLAQLRNDHRKAIIIGFQSALINGLSLGYPMIDCDILLLEFKANNRCGLPVISSAASQCLTTAMSKCSPVLLEPIMMLEVVIPKEHNGTIMGDLTASRRGIVLSTQARTNGTIVIRSTAPLSTLADYSEFLRIHTSGRGSFSMELFKYSAMSELEKQNVIRV